MTGPHQPPPSPQIIIPRGAQLQTPIKHIVLQHGEHRGRCRCGHMGFHLVVEFDAKRSAARIKSLVCEQCGDQVPVRKGVLQRHGKVSTHG